MTTDTVVFIGAIYEVKETVKPKRGVVLEAGQKFKAMFYGGLELWFADDSLLRLHQKYLLPAIQSGHVVRVADGGELA